jgi:hypothetical protein
MRVGLGVSFLFTISILIINPYRRRSDDIMHMMSQVCRTALTLTLSLPHTISAYYNYQSLPIYLTAHINCS